MYFAPTRTRLAIDPNLWYAERTMDDPVEVIEGEVLPYLPQGALRNSALRRSEVVTAFNLAFQMIGGVPRMALWADQNPGEFYKLYSRLLPSQASQELDSISALRVVHALPPPPSPPSEAGREDVPLPVKNYRGS
jgi:hypothetical protein